MDEIISYKMCAVKVRNAKLRNYLKGLNFDVHYTSSIFSSMSGSSSDSESTHSSQCDSEYNYESHEGTGYECTQNACKVRAADLGLQAEDSLDEARTLTI